MCGVNDRKRTSWKNEIDKYQTEANKYQKFQSDLAKSETILSNLKETINSLGNLCSYIKLPNAIDNGLCASYANNISNMLTTVAKLRASLNSSIINYQYKIRDLQSKINNLPKNCGACNECVPTAPVVKPSSQSKTTSKGQYSSRAPR